jgi:hypothetical protein
LFASHGGFRQDLGYETTEELIGLLNEVGRLLKGYSGAITASV